MKKLALILAWLTASLACRDPYTEVSIAPAASVSRDWVEVRAPRPLTWEQPVEEVVFHVDSPHQRSTQVEIVAPNGERAVPEVELVSTDGRTFVMDSHGFWGEDMFFTRDKVSVKTIQGIRIRNNFPIQISNVRWVGHDPAKVKR